MKKMNNRSGFTLIELMVVIVIVGILSAVAIPKFMGASAKAKMSEVPTNIRAFETAQLSYIAETGKPGKIDEIIFDKPTDSKWFTYADGDSAGSIKVTAKSAIGSFPKDGTITSTYDATENKFIHGSSDTTNAKKLIPNFF